MNGYYIRTALRPIETALLALVVLAIIVGCLLGWLIFPLIWWLTPWHTFAIGGFALWLLWVMGGVGFEFHGWYRARRISRADR